MIEVDELARRFEKLTAELGDATLVAVTKYSDVREITMAYDLGHRDFGENRVADLESKAQAFKDEEIRWHFIGHLQSNKVAKLIKVPNLYAIHSVDSLKLLQEIMKRESELRAPLRLFFQVNTSGEEEKGGFENYQELARALSYFLKSTRSALIFEGLMTMGTYRTDDRESEARRCFRSLKDYAKKLKNEFGLSHLQLSMGMSDDYGIALEEGAHVVRVGSLLFK